MAERRYTLVFFVAVVVALMATYGVYRVLELNEARTRVETRSVVLAAKDIPEGGTIELASLTTKEWPLATIPPGTFAVIDSAVGRVARVPIYTGEVVIPGRLAPAGTGPGLEVKIAPGMRAMAIKINDVAGIAGLVQPNSRVDVLVTLRAGQDRAQQIAKLFMENMRVLSMGTTVERGDDGKPINATTATLEVRPDEAERLAIAANQGAIQLVLRGFSDRDSIKTTGATSADVLTQLRAARGLPVPDERPRQTARRPVRRATPPAPQPRPAPPAVVAQVTRPESLAVQIYRGNRVSQQKFAKDTSGKATTPEQP
jgi:pilus assembly protein CpaB